MAVLKMLSGKQLMPWIDAIKKIWRYAVPGSSEAPKLEAFAPALYHMVFKGRFDLKPGEKVGDLYRAVAVYPILLKWIQGIVSSRLNAMRNMTRMWDSTQLGIRKGDGAAVLMLMVRSVVCAPGAYCVAQGFPGFAILSFARWKCFPTFVMKYFGLVFEKAGVCAQHPLRRLAMDILDVQCTFLRVCAAQSAIRSLG